MVDTWLVIIFTIEMILKIFVMGLMGMDDSYLSDPWNRLDGAIVMTSLIPKMVGNDNSVGIFGTFRVLRSFRPLRIAARSEELRVVLMALFQSIPAMVNVLAVLFLVWLIFGILSVQLFGGKFYYCYPTELNFTIFSGFTDKQKCINAGGSWINTYENFDNVLEALKALFIVSTLEGWHLIMQRAVDATDVDQNPIQNANPGNAIFFVIFIVVGSFFLVSLFVGVIAPPRWRC